MSCSSTARRMRQSTKVFIVLSLLAASDYYRVAELVNVNKVFAILLFLLCKA